MGRYCAVALLTLLSVAGGVARPGGRPDKDVTITDKLTKDDRRDTKRSTPCKVHVVKLKAGRQYTIDLVSAEFDTYLRLEDKDGNELAEDDDGGEANNARIRFSPASDGDYKIVATTFNAQAVGNYTLTVQQAAEQKVSAGHETLLGKAAPDFEGDTAVGGKAVRLSDLRGKVVLLVFLEVRSPESAAALARVREWHQAHKGEGLEIVGVTYYPHEFGQQLALEKESGKLKGLPRADRESDLALLSAYAGHHKVEHLLLALPKEAALKTFNAYLVNGLPQLVLIDREGIVRAVRAGAGEKTAEALHAELKKLLAAK